MKICRGKCSGFIIKNFIVCTVGLGILESACVCNIEPADSMKHEFRYLVERDFMPGSGLAEKTCVFRTISTKLEIQFRIPI